MQVVEVHGREGSPVVVSVPHTGEWIPPEVAQQLAVAVEAVRKRFDDYAWDLAQAALPHARVVRALVSRTVIDLNRSGTVTEVDLSHDPQREGERLVRLFGHDGKPLWRAHLGASPLSRKEIERRIRRYHEPYHGIVQHLLDKAPRPCALVDMHSMDETAYDLVIGDFRGRSAGVDFCEQVRAFFLKRGYRVGYAGPRPVDRRGRPLSPVAVRHSGGYITSRYGDPAHGCHAIQIETARPTAARCLERMRGDYGEFFAWLRAEMEQRRMEGGDRGKQAFAGGPVRARGRG